MRVLFIGPQGSGKSTQAKLLAQYLTVPYISTGDIFRDIASQDSEQGRKIRQSLDLGKLVDDQTTAEIVKQRVTLKDYQNGFIFDGYPRNLQQIKYFDPGFDKVIYLKLSDEDATKRLLERGRKDDTPQLISERLEVYHKQTDPILDYYQNKGLVEVIDGTGTIDEIHKHLKEMING